MRRVGAAAGLAALLLAACTPSHGATPRTAGSSPAVSATAPASAPLTPYYRQRLTWTGCGDGFSCTSLRVPLDYAHPDAGDLRLAVVRLPATGQRIGALVLNPGGPGGSGVDYARAANAVVSDRVRERFDVVGFDPRGVGRSAPVECVSDRTLDELVAEPADPRTPAQVADVKAGARGLAAGCAAHSRRLLAHVGTVDTARDMDVLRAALGDPKLTYLGKSYGTFLGATYAELFPTHVRAAVLDGAVDPTLDASELNIAQAQGFEVDLREFLRYCAGKGSCGTSPQEATRRLDALLARLDRTSLPAPNAPGDRRLTSGTATYGLAAGLYAQTSWPLLGLAVREAEQGDGSGLLMFADELTDREPNGRYSNQVEANTAINCVDRPAPRDVSAYAADAATARGVAPHFGPAIVWGALPCAFWPAPPETRPHPIRAPGSPPLLVVGTARDPATPYRWAQSLASQLAAGVLLTYDGVGHTAYRRGSDCVDSAVDAYLIIGRPPAAGTRCPG